MVDSVCDKVGRMTETLAISSHKTFTYNMIPIWKRQNEVGFCHWTLWKVYERKHDQRNRERLNFFDRGVLGSVLLQLCGETEPSV